MYIINNQSNVIIQQTLFSGVFATETPSAGSLSSFSGVSVTLTVLWGEFTPFSGGFCPFSVMSGVETTSSGKILNSVRFFTITSLNRFRGQDAVGGKEVAVEKVHFHAEGNDLRHPLFFEVERVTDAEAEVAVVNSIISLFPVYLYISRYT